MGIFDLFSKRQKRLKGEVPEVYNYNIIPPNLRVQVIHIIRDTIGEKNYLGTDLPKETYKFISDILCREYGRFSLLPDTYRDDPMEQVLNFLLQTQNVNEVVDVIELTFRYIDKVIRNDYQNYCHFTNVKQAPDEAIDELNDRFKENGIGFAYENGEMIRIDSTYIHSEVVKPALALLYNSKFEGACEEYLKAHEHYRHGRNKESLTDCLKAFESTMKIICKEKGWSFAPTDTARKLIQICFQNGLIPNFTQNQFSSLNSLLESGIPTLRNKLGGHGQGQVPQTVDDGITRYGLNLTGTNIIFLVEQSGL